MKEFDIFVCEVRMCQILCLALCLCEFLRVLGSFESSWEFLRVWECLRVFNTTKICPLICKIVSIFIEKRLEMFYTRDLSVVGF